VKAREPPVYISKQELTDLLIFCANFGAEPWFDFWWPYNSEYDHSFVSLTPAEVMDLEGADGETKKAFRVKEEIAKEHGHHREEFTESRSAQDFSYEIDRGHSVSIGVARAIPVEKLEQVKEDDAYEEEGVMRDILLPDM
jgi:Holliday junction resolvase